MKYIKSLLIPILVISFWYFGSKLNLFNSYLIPPPAQVMKTAIVLTKKGLLVKHLLVSLYRVLIGFILTFIVAFPLAVFFSTKPNTYRYLEPSLEFIRHIPPIALIPMLILWFGIGELSKTAVIFLATFFPVFLNTLSAITHCDQKLLEVGDIFHFDKKTKFLKIILPQAIPQILVGIQLGLGYSWRSLIGAELIAASSGIGYMIIEAEQLARPDIIIVGIFTIGILGCLIDFTFLKLTKNSFKWNREY